MVVANEVIEFHFKKKIQLREVLQFHSVECVLIPFFLWKDRFHVSCQSVAFYPACILSRLIRWRLGIAAFFLKAKLFKHVQTCIIRRNPAKRRWKRFRFLQGFKGFINILGCHCPMLKHLYWHRNVRSCDSYSPCASPLALINTHKKHFNLTGNFCSFCGPEIWRPSTKHITGYWNLTWVHVWQRSTGKQLGPKQPKVKQFQTMSHPCRVWKMREVKTSVEVFFPRNSLDFHPIAGKLREAKTSKHWISSYSKAP